MHRNTFTKKKAPVFLVVSLLLLLACIFGYQTSAMNMGDISDKEEYIKTVPALPPENPAMAALARENGIAREFYLGYNEVYVKHAILKADYKKLYATPFKEVLNLRSALEQLNKIYYPSGYRAEKIAEENYLMEMTPEECKAYLNGTFTDLIKTMEKRWGDSALSDEPRMASAYFLLWSPLDKFGPMEDLLDRIPWEIALDFVNRYKDTPNEQLNGFQQYMMYNCAGWLEVLGIEY